MKRLIIIGAGGCGREVLQWAMDINDKTPRWDFFGFLDYDEHALDDKDCPAAIIGNDDTYLIQEDDEFICAIGDGALREKIMTRMQQRGAQFIHLIHPTAVVARSASLGDGVIVYPYASITTDTTIGKGCIINMNSYIAHDVTMGAFCTISPNCTITGACNIEDHVFIGVGAHVIPSIYIGNHAFICAGSIVLSDVKEYTKVIGNPAKEKSRIKEKQQK